MDIAVIIERAGARIFRCVISVDKPGDLATGVHDAIIKFHHENSNITLLEGQISIRFEHG